MGHLLHISGKCTDLPVNTIGTGIGIGPVSAADYRQRRWEMKRGGAG